jgi:hypothetical protein
MAVPVARKRTNTMACVNSFKGQDCLSTVVPRSPTLAENSASHPSLLEIDSHMPLSVPTPLSEDPNACVYADDMENVTLVFKMDEDDEGYEDDDLDSDMNATSITFGPFHRQVADVPVYGVSPPASDYGSEASSPRFSAHPFALAASRPPPQQYQNAQMPAPNKPGRRRRTTSMSTLGLAITSDMFAEMASHTFASRVSLAN